MYLEFFRLQRMPFRLAPDPAFLYRSAGHTAALARIRSTLGRPNASVALIGYRGVGKSTILEHVAREYRRDAPIRISFAPPSLQALATILAPTEQEAAAPPLVLCDNAHLFTPQMLSRLLQRPLRLVLAGEPGLAAVLATPTLSRLIPSESCTLPPLRGDEVAPYIGHRLAVAGLPESKVFGDDICADIFRETRGNPRLVNALCDAVMALACERELPRVGTAEVLRGLEEIAALSRAQEGELPEADLAPAEAHAAPPAIGAFAQLQVVHEGRVLQQRELTRGILRVGRGADNDLRIEGQYVSRNHCRIVTNAGMSLLEDVHSTNGLYVNDRRVRNYRLRDGDVIQLGEHELRYADYRSGKDDAG